VDARSCEGAEAAIAHITVETARWSPDRDPFNKVIWKRLAARASELGAHGPEADTEEVRRAISTAARAFSDVAGAMKSKQRARVDQAIASLRVAYKGLRQTCSFDRR
jgi:hypothetical protein